MSDDVQPSPVISEPSPNGNNGRSKNGRFTKGNKGGPGNPQAPSVSRLRQALLKAVTPEDITAIAKQLLEDAKKGDVAATRELLDRLFGKSKEAIELTGPNGGDLRSEVKHTFDHARFAELYLSRTGRSQHGADHASGNGNGKSLHPDSSN